MKSFKDFIYDKSGDQDIQDIIDPDTRDKRQNIVLHHCSFRSLISILFYRINIINSRRTGTCRPLSILNYP